MYPKTNPTFVGLGIGRWSRLRCAVVVLMAAALGLEGDVLAGVTITSPVPGDTWIAGQDVEITWTKTADIPDDQAIGVTMRRPNDGPGFRVLLATSLNPRLFVAGDGAASFRIPDWVGDESDYTLTLGSGDVVSGELFTDSVPPISIVGSTCAASNCFDRYRQDRGARGTVSVWRSPQPVLKVWSQFR